MVTWGWFIIGLPHYLSACNGDDSQYMYIYNYRLHMDADSADNNFPIFRSRVILPILPEKKL
jgi:hypothetical protein